MIHLKVTTIAIALALAILGCGDGNNPPEVTGWEIEGGWPGYDYIYPGTVAYIGVWATDDHTPRLELEYFWWCTEENGRIITFNDPTREHMWFWVTKWMAPMEPGLYHIYVDIGDGYEWSKGNELALRVHPWPSATNHVRRHNDNSRTLEQ